MSGIRRKVFAHPSAEFSTPEGFATTIQEALQIVVQLHRSLVAVLPQNGRAPSSRSDLDRLESLISRTWTRNLVVAEFLQRGEIAVSSEQALSGEQLVQHDSHAEDVAAPVDLAAVDLLGREVAELALEDARPWSCRLFLLRGRCRSRSASLRRRTRPGCSAATRRGAPTRAHGRSGSRLLCA